MSFKLYVGNIPFVCTKYDIDKYFKNFEGYIDCQLVKYKNSKLNKGYAFISFDTLKNCVKVLKNDNLVIMGRKLKCNFYIKKFDEDFIIQNKNVRPDHVIRQTHSKMCIDRYLKMFKKLQELYNKNVSSIN